jgi:capsular polysaccharide export protein
LDYLDIQSILPTQLTHHQSAKKSSDEEDKSTLPERYLFVPFQIETDSQIIRNSPWIQSMEQLWEVLCRVIDQCEDTELQIVIKEHPLEKKRYKHLHNKHERILFFNNTTTQSLIENSTAVLTINSTVGIESLLLKKQLLVLGKACYRLTGLSSGISNENQLNNTINRLTELQCDEKLRQGFLNFLHTYYAIPEYWNKAKAKHFIALERRLTKQDHLGKVLSQTYCADKNIQAA